MAAQANRLAQDTDTKEEIDNDQYVPKDADQPPIRNDGRTNDLESRAFPSHVNLPYKNMKEMSNPIYKIKANSRKLPSTHCGTYKSQRLQTQ